MKGRISKIIYTFKHKNGYVAFIIAEPGETAEEALMRSLQYLNNLSNKMENKRIIYGYKNRITKEHLYIMAEKGETSEQALRRILAIWKKSGKHRSAITRYLNWEHISKTRKTKEDIIGHI